MLTVVEKSNSDQPGNPKEAVEPRASLQVKGEVSPQQRVGPHLSSEYLRCVSFCQGCLNCVMNTALVMVTNLPPGAADKAGNPQILKTQVGEDLMEE